ncbi:MAG: M1 family aminopeptidase [Bdellovibrio sp.]
MSRTQALHKLLIVIGLLLVLLVTLQSPAAPLQHKMQVELLPGLKMIKAQDTLTFPQGTPRKLSFLLHKDLQISVTSVDDYLTLLHPATDGDLYVEYGLVLSGKDDKVSFNYFGVIYDPIVNNISEGLISPEGAALFGSTYWYPFFLDMQKSFDVSVKTPIEWTSLVQGQIASTQTDAKFRTSRFVEIYPQEEIYLVAGPFHSYGMDMGKGKKVQVLLRKDEPTLAENFLSLIPDYIQHYSDTIAPYPYPSFTVVENFWETGYGMPSFTLLGPSVIRLPFILNSSLPHEILHNWWGNSVYVDYDQGNWSEGLTTYMADHWQQEKIERDRAYRLNTLINYNDFVQAHPERDFPLRQFKGRHNSSSQAVGYGKSMMFFHMLNFFFGKDLFKKSLQTFYADNLFQKASFRDIQKSFEKVTQTNLNSFFSQWLDREGAPQLALGEVKVLRWHDGAYSTTYSLEQTQTNPPYDLHVPIVWTLESGEEARQLAPLSGTSQLFSLVTHSRPVKIAVDPDYHLFRILYAEERPATLSSILGAPTVHFYLDEKNSDAQKFAHVWSSAIEGQSSVTAVSSQLPTLPHDGSVVFVGDNAAFAQFMTTQLQGQKFELHSDKMIVGEEEFLFSESSTVLVTRHHERPSQSIMWVRWAANMDAEEWASRLTHYSSFGILVFKGRPAVLKSTWPVLRSPLQKDL